MAANVHEKGQADLEDLIKEILNRHSFLHEKRIQKLIFLADLHSIQTRGRRLVNADFKPYFHGVFSDDVHLALQNLKEARVSPDTAPDGRITIVFLGPEKPFKSRLGKVDLQLLEDVLKAYKGLSTDELAQIGKHSLLWETTEHNEIFDYEAYMKNPASRTSPAMIRAYDATIRTATRQAPPAFDSIEALMRTIP